MPPSAARSDAPSRAEPVRSLAEIELPRHVAVVAAFDRACAWAELNLDQTRSQRMPLLYDRMVDQREAAEAAIELGLYRLAQAMDTMADVAPWRPAELPAGDLGARLAAARTAIARALRAPASIQPAAPAAPVLLLTHVPTPTVEATADAPPEVTSRTLTTDDGTVVLTGASASWPEVLTDALLRALVVRLPPALRALAAPEIGLVIAPPPPARGLRILAGAQPLRGAARIERDEDGVALVIDGALMVAGLPHLAWTLPPRLRGPLLAELASPQLAARPHRDVTLTYQVGWSSAGLAAALAALDGDDWPALVAALSDGATLVTSLTERA